MVVAFLKGIFGYKTKDTFIASLRERKKRLLTYQERSMDLLFLPVQNMRIKVFDKGTD